MKRFDIQDGLGIRLLQWAGIEVAIVSGRVSEATAIRARELDIIECHQDGGAQKIRAIKGILERLELDWDQVAMLGDDLPDLAVLRKVGVPAVVANATEEVRKVAVWQGKSGGPGRGPGVLRGDPEGHGEIGRRWWRPMSRPESGEEEEG